MWIPPTITAVLGLLLALYFIRWEGPQTWRTIRARIVLAVLSFPVGTVVGAAGSFVTKPRNGLQAGAEFLFLNAVSGFGTAALFIFFGSLFYLGVSAALGFAVARLSTLLE